MLASPVADEDEVLTRLGTPVWVEDKYDGIRAQLHKQGEVRLYSRDLHDVSDGYPEVVAQPRTLTWDGILDGELLAFRDGMAMPFLQLQARLGRKNPSEEMQRQIPVIYVGVRRAGPGPGGGAAVEPTLRLPLRERRQRLDALGLPQVPGMATANLLTAATSEELQTIFDAAQERGNEGLMVKDPDSIYTPGRRGYGWLKLKRPLATLDCVVVGVEVGHGKRHGVLSDYTFAVLDDRPGADGRLVTIGKAYSGLTDEEIAEMTEWFKAHTLQQLGRYHVVEPTVVVEIAFDVIHRSNRHDSGFALRFPRIFRLRPDKDVREIDTLSNVEMLYRGWSRAGGSASRRRPARPAGMTDEEKVQQLRELLPPPEPASTWIRPTAARFRPRPRRRCARPTTGSCASAALGRTRRGRDQRTTRHVPFWSSHRGRSRPRSRSRRAWTPQPRTSSESWG